MEKNFANTGVLIRFKTKSDRLRLLLWILGISIFIVSIAALLPELYQTQADKQVLAETMVNPAITFMLGYSVGLSNYTDGAILGHFMIVFSAIFTAIMSILLVTRHTREDEEEGRTEMINSLPVGSLSNLTATFIILAIVNVIISLLIGFGIYLLDIETVGFEGSMLYGAVVGVIGIFYASLTGLFAQIASNTRTTLSFSFGFLILDYIIRGIGDTGIEILSYISPLGLIVKTEVYVNNNWWPILVLLIISLIMFAISLYLNSIRDLGSGMLPAKPGRSNGSRFLSSPLGLSLRIQRTTIIAWLVGVFVLGLAYGSVLGELEGFINNSELVQLMLPESQTLSLTDRFITMLITIISALGTIPIVMFVLRLISEEKHNRTEQLLASPVSRNRLLASYTIIGLIGSVLVQFLSILGLWSAAAFVMEDLVSFNVLLNAALINIPAMLVFVSIAVFLIGCLPKLTSLTWMYLGFSFFVEYMGQILQLPDWLIKLSPFNHIPNLADEEIQIRTFVIMGLVSFFLIGLGFVAYNKRDIEG